MVTTIFIIIEVLFSAALFIGTHLVEKLSNDDTKPVTHRYTCHPVQKHSISKA